RPRRRRKCLPLRDLPVDKCDPRPRERHGCVGVMHAPARPIIFLKISSQVNPRGRLARLIPSLENPAWSAPRAIHSVLIHRGFQIAVVHSLAKLRRQRLISSHPLLLATLDGRRYAPAKHQTHRQQNQHPLHIVKLSLTQRRDSSCHEFYGTENDLTPPSS